MGHVAPELERNKARCQPKIHVDRDDLHAHGFDRQPHSTEPKAEIFRRRKQKPRCAETVNAFQRRHIAQHLGAASGVKNRSRKLPIGLMQGIERHDLHRQGRSGKLRAAEKVHQGGTLGQRKARKIGSHHVQQRGKTREQAAHGLAVVVAPGDGKLAHDQRRHG